MTLSEEVGKLVICADGLRRGETLSFTVDVPYREKIDQLVSEARAELDRAGMSNIELSVASESVVTVQA